MSTDGILSDITQNQGNETIGHSSEECQTNPQGIKKPTVTYICNDTLLKTCDRLPKTPRRASIVHSLISAYGLLEDLIVVSPTPASEDDLLLFHSQDYIDCVKHLSNRDDDEKYEEEDEQYGLTYDCPAFPGAHDYALYVTGGSIQAAKCLLSGRADIAIHWTGGWHHAKRDEASGFCYYNDIVIAILKLRQKFERVLYIDLDLHHGDGVEDAFSVTPKVMTVSFHKYSPGFFPGTGSVSSVGLGKGKYHTVNVPLKDGIQDSQFIQVFKRVFDAVYEWFEPEAIVCQCGADGLVNDPMDSFNLTPRAHVECVRHVTSSRQPLLLLGGGGYNTPNTARCWTSITASVLGHTLPDDIPEHQYFPLYGPDYDLTLSPGNRRNENSSDYIEDTISVVLDNIHQVGAS